MGKNQIRLHYSGFVVFTTQLLGVITGLIYTLLLTRNMSISQYGIWTNIFDYIAYFALFSSVLPFWATRFTAREKQGSVKTAVFAQLTIAVVSFLIYLPAIFLISHAIGTSSGYLLIYFVAGLYILTFYMVSIFESLLQATKPQATGYGFIIQEIVKVGVALVLILGFGEIFVGAILALILGPAVQIMYYVYLLSGYIKEKANWSYLKEWFKGSPAIAYNLVGSQLVSFVLILLFIFGGSASRAYYQAALSFTTIVGYASSLAFALYPKLLANACTDDDVKLSFRTVLMLAIPLATITMVMSVSFLTVLNIAYSVAWPVLIALTANTLVTTVSMFYSNCLLGVEAFDAEGKISIRHLIRSKIFKVFSIPYLQAAIALPATYFVLTRLPDISSVQATLYVIIILIAVNISTFSGLYWFMRHSIRILVAWKNIAKYILAALLMGGVLFFLPTTTTLLSTIAKAIGGFALYVGLLLAIDEQARSLVRLIWQEITFTLKQLTHGANNSGENVSVASEN